MNRIDASHLKGYSDDFSAISCTKRVMLLWHANGDAYGVGNPLHRMPDELSLWDSLAETNASLGKRP